MADFSYEQNFDALTNGDLNGQDSWSGSALYDVQDSVAFGTGKSLSKAGTQATISRSITGVDGGEMYVALRASSVGASGYHNLQLRLGATLATYVSIVGSGNLLVAHSGGSTSLGTAAANTWYIFHIEFLSATTFRVRVRSRDGAWGSWTSTLTYLNSASSPNTLLLNADDEGSGRVAYWDSISPTEPALTLTDNLISYWKLDEASGTREDAHGSNDLTDNNTVSAATGVINDGADFERDNSEFLSITDASQTGLDLTGDLTFSMWIILESQPPTNEQYAMFGKWASGTGAYSLNYADNAGTKQFVLILYDSGTPGTNVNFRKNQTLSSSVLYHIVVTYDASANTAEFFLNGSSVGTNTGDGTVDVINNSTGAFVMGQFAGGRFFDGVIDEFGVWDRILDSAEISSLYNSGSGFAYPFTTATETNDARPAELSGQAVVNAARAAETHGIDTAANARAAEATGALGSNSARAAELHGIATTTNFRAAQLTGQYAENTWQIERKIGAGDWEVIEAAIVIDPETGTFTFDDESITFEHAETYCYRVKNLTDGSAYSNQDCVVFDGSADVSDSRAAELHGVATHESSRNAQVHGKLTDNDERPAEMHGSDSAQVERPAEIRGVDTAQTQRPSVLTGQDASTASRAAELTGSVDTQTERDAEIHGIDTQTASRNAELRGQDAVADTRSAELKGMAEASDTRTAELEGANGAAVQRPAELHGIATESERRDAVLTGADSADAERGGELHGEAVVADERAAELYAEDTSTATRAAELSGKQSANETRTAELHGEATEQSAREAQLTGSAPAQTERGATVRGVDTDAAERPAALHGRSVHTSARGVELEGTTAIATQRGAELHGEARTTNTRAAALSGKPSNPYSDAASPYSRKDSPYECLGEIYTPK